MKGHSLRLLALCSVPLVGACADEGVVGLDGPAVEIEVAPLTLPGIGAACYDVTVYNAPGGAAGGGQIVWSKGQGPGHSNGIDAQPATADDALLVADNDAICSTQYGNNGGGDIAYVGPCDADAQEDTSDAAGEKTNSITVWFDGLYGPSGTPLSYIDPAGPNGWVNPCPNGCTINFLCEENADNLALFNFTVMRDAQQGFFDIAVNFEDIFCSGKYDTCYEGTEDIAANRIQLLFGNDVGDGAGRDDTGVLALACTGGADENGTDIKTTLSYSKVKVVCGTETFDIDLSKGPGQWDAIGSNSTSLQYAIYNDDEQLACPPTNQPGSCNKVFLNVAINLEDLPAGNCHLSAQATAESNNNQVLTNGVLTAANTTYPFFNVGIKDMKACQQNPLNGPGSGVGTVYGSNGYVGSYIPQPMCYSTVGAGVTKLSSTTAVDLYANAASARLVYNKASLGDRIGFFGKNEANCDGTAQVRNLGEFTVYQVTEAASGTKDFVWNDAVKNFLGLERGAAAAFQTRVSAHVVGLNSDGSIKYQRPLFTSQKTADDPITEYWLLADLNDVTLRKSYSLGQVNVGDFIIFGIKYGGSINDADFLAAEGYGFIFDLGF